MMHPTTLAPVQATPDLFITATGTGVGKTYLTSQLLIHDQQHHQKLQAYKPVISGWPRDSLEIPTTDTGIFLQAQNLAQTQENIENCSPWRLGPPLTPWMALQEENKQLSLTELTDFCKSKLLEAHSQNRRLLFEGVGGIMAPLTEHATVLDWIEALALNVILVTGTYLGTLSHTLCAVNVLKSKGIIIQSLVVNETHNSTVGLAQTVSCLKAFLPDINIISLRYGYDAADKALSELYQLILCNR